MRINNINKISQNNNNLKSQKNIKFGTNYPNFPERVAIAINKSCNLRCSYCPNSQLKTRIFDRLMPMELFKKI